MPQKYKKNKYEYKGKKREQQNMDTEGYRDTHCTRNGRASCNSEQGLGRRISHEDCGADTVPCGERFRRQGNIGVWRNPPLTLR